MKQSFSLRELIEYALKREVFSKRIYEKILGMVEDNEAKMIIIELANFEASHIQDFSVALEREIRREKINVSEFLKECEEAPLEIPELFKEKDLEKADLPFILNLAKKMEKEMASFYKDLSKQIDNPHISETADKLSIQEMEHIKYIKRAQEILNLDIETQEGEFHAQ
ncbi:MAG: ferritin family protein [Thermoanaerobaculia bacterium]